ncbi:adenylate/guanylate cyclase domain-containing protein [Propionivibrio dicarboxylicus]|uniref:Adenylate cyclase, class 3 n=1 Tax=Propionivibrio dicarboxylicus TaxID=83767 RepID=A0A1G8FTZ8_9RHOO|nr:adenylate/guanylate cyclase domain-containing protein [Propionivibrio dicarboxylicus]SDH85600.1 Adenylate cyclase, class 3 [Propionivibrio dicarboxylicus]
MNGLDWIIQHFHNAGVDASDSDELRLKKTLLVSATVMIGLAATLWLLIYQYLGPHVSVATFVIFQAFLWGNLVIYLKGRNFNRFRLMQLLLILIMPFVAQWRMGSLTASSGISLWALLAPIGAILFIGARESRAWFVAYLALILLSGTHDVLLADIAPTPRYDIPLHTTAFFFALNFTAVSMIVYLLLRQSALEKQKAQARIEATNTRLRIEQDRSEHLLLNILPAPIAARLKSSNQTIADGIPDVSVMFVDIVNFTRVAEGMRPQQVFAMLNRIFSAFDELAEKHGLEKIKTIGDAYMVAGGLNHHPADYSVAIVELAFDMQALLQSDIQASGIQLDIRIGIATGSVVAGVVGKKKFTYDLWGDTVNTASRITGECTPGAILVDAATHRRLDQYFDFEVPRPLQLKGKGTLEVYRILGPKALSAIA